MNVPYPAYMLDEPMSQEFAELKLMLNEHFTFLEGRFAAIDRRFEKIDERFERIDRRFDLVDMRFSELDGKIDEVDRRLTSRIDALTASMDGFIKLHQTLDVELASNRAKTDRLESRIERLEARTA